MRKVVGFGKSSLVVSLPKAWAELNRIKKGATVFVDEKPDELIISSVDNSKNSKAKEVVISGKNSISELKTEITSAYINAAHLIRITGLETKTVPEVKAILHDLVGIEVIEEDSHTIVAKDFLDISEVSIDSIIRRMDLLTRSMINDSLQADEDRYESINDRDNEVNRLSKLGFRVARVVLENPSLLKMFNTTLWDVVLCRQVLIQLERFADQTKRIARILRNVKDKKKKRAFYEHYALINDRYLMVMKAHYSKNKEESYKLEGATKALFKTTDSLFEEYKDTEMIRLSEFLKHMITSMNSIVRSIMERSP